MDDLEISLILGGQPQVELTGLKPLPGSKPPHDPLVKHQVCSQKRPLYNCELSGDNPHLSPLVKPLGHVVLSSRPPINHSTQVFH
jgi:hypothetical protein